MYRTQQRSSTTEIADATSFRVFGRWEVDSRCPERRRRVFRQVGLGLAGLFALSLTIAYGTAAQAQIAEKLGPAPEASTVLMTTVAAGARDVAMVVSDGADKTKLFLDGKLIANGRNVVSVTLSADGERFAYAVHDGARWQFVIDGTSSAEFDPPGYAWTDRVAFSSNGKHVAYVARKDGHEFVVKDGVAGPQFDRISRGIASPGTPWSDYQDVRRIAPFGRIGYISFSLSGDHFAYAATRNGVGVLVVDGKEVLSGIDPSWAFVVFSADGRHTAYQVRLADNVQHFFVDGADMASHDVGFGPVFSGDGAHYALSGSDFGKGPDNFVANVSVDAKIRSAFLGGALPDSLSELTFSPDGRRLAFDRRISAGRPVGRIYTTHRVEIDGIPDPEFLLVAHIVFSPDSLHYAYLALNGRNKDIGDGVSQIAGWSAVVDSKVGSSYQAARGPVFSADSRHVAYAAMRDGHWLMVLDGRTLTDYEPVVSRASSFAHSRQSGAPVMATVHEDQIAIDILVERLRAEYKKSAAYSSAQIELDGAQQDFSESAAAAVAAIERTPAYQSAAAIELRTEADLEAIQADANANYELNAAICAVQIAKANLAGMRQGAIATDSVCVRANARLAVADSKINHIEQQFDLSLRANPDYAVADARLRNDEADAGSAGDSALSPEDGGGVTDDPFPTSYKFDDEGDLLYIGIKDGQIFRLKYKPDNAVPTIKS